MRISGAFSSGRGMGVDIRNAEPGGSSGTGRVIVKRSMMKMMTPMIRNRQIPLFRSRQASLAVLSPGFSVSLMPSRCM